MSTWTVLIVITIISGSYTLDTIWDEKFQDEWTGTCAKGLLQSPIAIPSASERNFTRFMRLEFTNMQMPIKQFTVTNLGRHTLFDWEHGSDPQRYFVLRTSQNVAPFHANTRYVLQNFHLHHNLNEHTGTNHAIGGSKYTMEMHMLFVLPKYDLNFLKAFEVGPGNTLEIAILWRLSDVHNEAWSQINNLLLSQKLSENQKITSGETSLRLTEFIPHSSTFSLYPGSMLFYNCLETNTWIVFDQPMDFDTPDLGMRHWTYISGGKVTPLHRNIRHVQSRNSRPVYSGLKQEVVFYG